jgi:3-hydroxyacyl-CoA dehydrogenase
MTERERSTGTTPAWGGTSGRTTVAVIELNNPPVNALSRALRLRVAAELTKAEQAPEVSAIVLVGNEKFFSAGADVKEFNTPAAAADPTLDNLMRRLERCDKPTIAAISGNCLGGGLELALSCHFRVATAAARIGFPEVKLGLIPGAGGTQRLPPLVGLQIAVNMIVSGEPMQAAELAHTPLFNRVVAHDVLEAARSLAGEIENQGIPIRRSADMRLNYPNHEAFLGFARNMVKAKAGPYPAPAACIDAIEAGVTASDFEAGMRKEREIFLGLLQAPESRALRHVFFAERAAPRIADVPTDTPTRPIARVAVIGGGTMGGGIAMNFLNAGLPVTLLELDQSALDKGIAAIRRNYESSAKRGKISATDLDERMALLRPTVSYDGLRAADLIIEAVFEDMAVKKQVFRQLDEFAKPGAILATNTSTLDVNTIARFTGRPADVLGMHFFSPANVMRLLEVIRGEATATDVLTTVMQTAKKIRKLAVVSGVCEGFIGNRMLLQYLAQAFALLEEGCVPAQVDRAIESFGFAMGPFRMSDLAGNDIGWAIRKRQYAQKGRPAQAHVADRLCEMGRFGQKTLAGWYDYLPGDRTPRPNADVDSMIVRHSEELGVARRDVGDVEIVERLVYALINEGARLLEEKIAQRASDIDLVYLNGYGFPTWRGGPLFYADTVGLGEVVSAMRRYARGRLASPWMPAPLLDRLAAAGECFESFDLSNAAPFL